MISNTKTEFVVFGIYHRRGELSKCRPVIVMDSLEVDTDNGAFLFRNIPNAAEIV